jgi:hypothetical protein
MKQLIFCLCCFCVAGCYTQSPKTSTFQALQDRVKRTLGTNYEYSSVMTNEDSKELFFEIKSQHSSLPITVTKREYITPKEWRNRYQAATNTFTEFFKSVNATNSAKGISAITNQPHFFERFTNALDSLRLPGWYYKDIGVDVGFSEPEITYPGVEENIKEAQDVVDKVVGCLARYQKTKSK